MIESHPVLAICGFSGAGKTTLILKLLQYLVDEKKTEDLAGPYH